MKKNYLNAEISHQIGLQRYQTGVVKSMLEHLKDVERDILARLSVMDAATKQTMEAYLQTVRSRITQFEALANRTLTEQGASLANYEVEFQIALLEKTTSKQLARVLPARLASAVTTEPFQGRLLGEWAAGLAAATYNGVRDAVRIGYTEGQTVQEIAKRIRGTAANRFKDGVLEISRRNAETVTRTALAGIANTSRTLLFQENKDLIKAEQWVSVLDSRTTEICAGLDGKEFAVGEGPRPPAHPNCRSTMIPIFRGIEPPERQTYGEWLKAQDAETVADVLGETKAKLFLDGGLSIDRFTDTTGRVYTIEELRARDEKAFNKADI